MLSQRIMVLKYLAEQKYGTLNDLLGGSGSQGTSEAFRVSLYRFGLSRFSYPNIPHGVWHIGNPVLLEELEQHFPDEPFHKSTDVHFNEVDHCLGLNKIRQALMTNPKVSIRDWWTEWRLKAMHPSQRDFDYRQIPDVIFWCRKSDGNLKKYFIEYERSLKSQARYESILRAYANREDVSEGSVVFICQHEFIRKELIRLAKRIFSKSFVGGQEELFRFVGYQQMVGEEASETKQCY